MSGGGRPDDRLTQVAMQGQPVASRSQGSRGVDT
jgi:hypothetical protein